MWNHRRPDVAEDKSELGEGQWKLLTLKGRESTAEQTEKRQVGHDEKVEGACTWSLGRRQGQMGQKQHLKR